MTARSDTQPLQSEGPDTATRLNDEERLLSLEKTGLMDSPEEDAFNRAVRLATAAIGTPVGLVSLVDGKRQFFKAQRGLTGQTAIDRQTPISHSFCQYVVHDQKPLRVADAREHPFLKSNKAVPDLGVIAYLGIPIHGPDGHTLGSFCAIDDQPHQWTDQEEEILSDLTVMIETEIKLRAEADEKALLLNEMNHRIGNTFSIINGMVSMTARESDDVDDMAQALRGRINALHHAHSLVRPALTNNEQLASSASLEELLQRLLEPHMFNRPDALRLEGPSLQIGPKGTTNISLIMHELATNSAKYGALSTDAGRLIVSWTRDTETLQLTWEEKNGPRINAAPDNKGFGSKLTDTTARLSLKGELTSDWQESGVIHKLTAQLARLNR